MRYKVLLALQELPEIECSMLDGISELDETFFLEFYKRKRFPDAVVRNTKPASIGHSTKNGVPPANMSASALAFNEKGVPMLPWSTGQNRMPEN